ncbi:histone-lysine N-methyltransferase SETMAR [Trichonephila clavipes]|nr:histone-lysine N-methyltransferase SETMAR [Trichonephila clavipes]
MCGVYGSVTATADYVQFWFRRFRSGIFDVKNAPHTGKHIIKNDGKITEIIEDDRHISSPSIAQKLKIDHKTVLNHLRKVGFKNELHVWVQHRLTPKNMMDRISICEALGSLHTKRLLFIHHQTCLVDQDSASKFPAQISQDSLPSFSPTETGSIHCHSHSRVIRQIRFSSLIHQQLGAIS